MEVQIFCLIQITYKTVGDAMNGLRSDERVVLMKFSGQPIIITLDIVVNRWSIIGSTQMGRNIFMRHDYGAKGKAKVIAENFSLGDIAQAYEKLASGNVRFRAVIKNEKTTSHQA